MIAYIEGKVLSVSERLIVVLTSSGVGYEINVLKRLEASVEQTIALHTILIHKEDSMTLFGFESKEEKNMFTTLMLAQGVGAKLSMEVLSYYSVSEIVDILFSQNIIKLKQVPGMGAKKAEKLLFELRDKINKINTDMVGKDSKNQAVNDAIKALISLGFTNTEITTALSSIDDKANMSTEKIITHSLKILASK